VAPLSRDNGSQPGERNLDLLPPGGGQVVVRAQGLFGFEYTLEMHKPAASRRWGYFSLPVLHDDRLIGKVGRYRRP